jgi:two-component system, chemotaxis family, chemotaxis protein CheY
MFERILIVDDSLTARMVIRRCMEISGFQNACFHEASNGLEGLNVLKENPVDLILTDLNMPEMNGRSFIRRLKVSPRLNSIPVIVISSIATGDEEADLLKSGASAVIRKPISPMSIMQAIESLDVNP